MIMRPENIQVGKGQYIYKTGRCIWGTKSTDPINGLGMSGHVHRLVKGEQRDKDKKGSWKKIIESRKPKEMKGTIPASCGRHHSFQPLPWTP